MTKWKLNSSFVKERRKIVTCKLRGKHVQPQVTQPKYTDVGVLTYGIRFFWLNVVFSFHKRVRQVIVVFFFELMLSQEQTDFKW